MMAVRLCFLTPGPRVQTLGKFMWDSWWRRRQRSRVFDKFLGSFLAKGYSIIAVSLSASRSVYFYNGRTLWRTLLRTSHSCRMRCVVFVCNGAGRKRSIRLSCIFLRRTSRRPFQRTYFMTDVAEDTTRLQNAVRSLLSAMEPEES
jgi:hypothetical protein